jgi:hypothetical protein
MQYLNASLPELEQFAKSFTEIEDRKDWGMKKNWIMIMASILICETFVIRKNLTPSR